jgi:hypothetical protein
MRVVYKINLFAKTHSRLTNLVLGIAMAVVIAFLFIKHNDLQDANATDQDLISQKIQTSIDTTSAQIQRFIKTINPIK